MNVAAPKPIFENKIVLKTERYPKESNQSQSVYNPASTSKDKISNTKKANPLFLNKLGLSIFD